MIRFLLVQLLAFFGANFVVGLITGDYLRGWSVDAAYGATLIYPLYLAFKNKDYRTQIIGLVLLWAYGRAFQYLPENAKADMFIYTIALYALFGVISVMMDKFAIAIAAGLISGFSIYMGAFGSGYVEQLIVNVAFAFMTIYSGGRVIYDPEKGESHTHKERIEKAA